MKLISGLDKGYWESDVERFIENITEAINKLETLAQMQKMAGGMNMDHESKKTFDLVINLKSQLSEIQTSRSRKYGLHWVGKVDK